MKTFISLIFVIVIFASFCGCSRVGGTSGTTASGKSWNPKTQALDNCANVPQMAGFIHDMKAFYENLHNKQWAETYKQRNQKFRSLVSKQVYLKEVKDSAWELVDYEVLPPIQQTHDSDGSNKIVTICKFIEGPIEHTAYNTITWTLEDGVWRPDCAGPMRLAIFGQLSR